MRTYQPRRASKRWLEGAPAHVLAVYDNGGESFDRYTILYGAPYWHPDMGHKVPYLAASEDPTHPLGFGQYGEMFASHREALGKKIAYQDLPERVREVVETDTPTDAV